MTLTFLFTTFLFILPASLFLLALAFVIFIRGSHGPKCLSSLGFGHAGGEILAAQISRGWRRTAGQLRHLAQPTLHPVRQAHPGLKLDNPRQLGLMHALVRFAQNSVGFQPRFSSRTERRKRQEPA